MKGKHAEKLLNCQNSVSCSSDNKLDLHFSELALKPRFEGNLMPFIASTHIPQHTKPCFTWGGHTKAVCHMEKESAIPRTTAHLTKARDKYSGLSIRARKCKYK